MKNFLLRDTQDDDIAWLKTNTPSGTSQNQFLKNIIRDARVNEIGHKLFDNPRIPSQIFGKLPFKIMDLFAGIRRFRSALTSLGGKCIFTNEFSII